MKNEISHISVQKLNKLSKRNEILCFGCGKRLSDMLTLYKDEFFVKKITVLIDNNRKIWGCKKDINGRKVLIDGIKNIGKLPENAVIIITSDKYREIYSQITNEFGKDIRCYAYPQYYYGYVETLFSLIGIMPLKRIIIFRAGLQPHENADEIVDYMVNQYEGRKYNLFYLVENANIFLKHVRLLDYNCIKQKSSFFKVLRYCLIYGRAQYLFYENEMINKIRRDQKLIYLNHGILPIKNVRDVLKQPVELDYAVCPSQFCAPIYEEQYGIPRNKFIFCTPPRVYTILKKSEKLVDILDVDKKIIVWLPTFRSLDGTDRVDSSICNLFDLLHTNEERLNEFLNNNHQQLVIKTHPREKQKIEISDKCENIIVLQEKDIQNRTYTLYDVLKMSDALITDYSSIAFEYMLLNRPIGYLVTDIQTYFRGFSVDNIEDYMPGERITSEDELYQFLNGLNHGRDCYKEKRECLVKNIYGKSEFNQGAKLLIDYLEGIDDRDN